MSTRLDVATEVVREFSAANAPAETVLWMKCSVASALASVNTLISATMEVGVSS